MYSSLQLTSSCYQAEFEKEMAWKWQNTVEKRIIELGNIIENYH